MIWLETCFPRFFRHLVAHCELPITAARLIEDIAEEESYLRARVSQLTATPRA